MEIGMNFYKHFIGDYARDTAHLSMLEHAAYRLLLDHYYATEQKLPMPAQCERICRAATEDEKQAVRSVLAQFFKSGLNERAEKEIKQFKDYGNAQAMRAHMRWQSLGNASHSHSHSHSQNPEPKPEKAKEAGRASRLPTDWKPSAEQIEFCKTERADLNPQTTAERFRDHWIAQPGTKGVKLDWSATWRNWVRNERRQSRAGVEANSNAAKEAARRIQERG